MHPVLASSAKTSPSASPTYRRPPTTTGCVPPVVAPGNPKAHFSFRRGTSAALKPAALAAWNRVLVIVTPQPFHSAVLFVLAEAATPFAQKAERGMMSGGTLPNFFSDRYSASIRRWARLRSA